MFKKRNLIFLSLLILGVFLITSCLPKPPVTEGILKGQVMVPEGSVQAKDLTGQALANATVNIIDPVTGAVIATTTTDASGYYQVFVPAGGPYLLEAVKDGVKLLQITPQVGVGIEYDLGTADCSTTAVALIALAMMDAGANLADINLADIAADPNFDDVLSSVTSIIEAGGDPTESAVIEQAVEDFLSPPSPAPPPPAVGTDATLSDLTVDGTTITGFDSATLNYSKELPYGTTTVPTVGATTNDSNATKVITQAVNLDGTEAQRTATVVVTAEDGTTQKTYTVTFSVAVNTDATLSDLTVDGTTITGFDSATLNYSKELPYGTTTVPTVGATTNDSNATKVITQAVNLDGTEAQRTATVVVTAEDGTTTKTYIVTFSVALKPVRNITQGTYYDTIQAAIDDADINTTSTIKVADGTYTENIIFPSDKVIVLISENGASSTEINGGNISSVVTINGCPNGTILDGFTITSGYGTSGGGGIYIHSCSPTIQNNTILGNTASNGSGIYIYFSAPIIQDNTISGNTATNRGGGININGHIDGSSTIIQNNTISGNTATYSGDDYGGGGGIYISSSHSPIIQNNTISGNETSSRGGGICSKYSSPIIQDNTISGNTAINRGGGIYIHYDSIWADPIIIQNNTISENISSNCGGGIYSAHSSLTIQDNTISGNTATYSGGGIHIDTFECSPSPTIQGNTISGNTSSGGGGIYIIVWGSPTIGGTDEDDNANFNAVCGNTPDQIYPDSFSNNYIFTNCDVIGETGPAGGLIFHDKGFVSDGWRYLEAAPGDQSASAEWGCIGTLTGADGSAVGTGKQNTIDILGGCAELGIAARLCNVLVEGDYNDWFLPSKAELNLMYANLHNIGTPVGGFESGLYWSSSEREGNAHNAWTQDFSNSDQNYYLKYSELRVRAIRAF